MENQDLPPAVVQLETRVSGNLVQTEVPLQAEGHFEAMLPARLPPARRGWRVARNRVTYDTHVLEACNVVLVPPADALAAVLIVLALDCSLYPGGPQRLAQMAPAARLPEMLAGLRHTSTQESAIKDQPSGNGSLSAATLNHAHTAAADLPIYYLACTDLARTVSQAELALAGNALGWPAGHFILLQTDPKEARTTFLQGIDRLRRLYCGTFDLVVLNLEPRMTPALGGLLESAPDLALVRRLIDAAGGGEWATESEAKPGAAAGSGYYPVPTGRSFGARPTRAALVPRYPVVFCHGMLAFSMLKMHMPEHLNCFSPLRDFLCQRGVRALMPQVPPTSGVAARAACLRDQIHSWTNEPVNLIAHSMGGLDARYLISRLGMGDRVKTLTTVSAPHRGTFLADWFLANFRNRVPLLLALEAFGVNVDGFRDCRPAACRAFNAQTPDDVRVRYFSYGGDVPSSKLSPVLRRAWSLLTPVEGANDGMVSLASARWGEDLGTVHADHFAQTPDAVFLRPGEDFDALGFYTRLVENLARRGY
jgi:triacylglycerol lipase